MTTKQDPADSFEDAAELEKMIREKTLENIQLLETIAKLNAEMTGIKSRAMKVYEDNEMMKAAPELAARMAEMKFELAMADQFIKSGAFPKGMTAEQAYTIIRAGAEMGMKPLEAMNTLYIVNGAIKPYGKNMIARLTGQGYKIEYTAESENGVTVTVRTPDGETFTEAVTKKDKVLLNSKAMGFSDKNKMRFHGVRMILDFHLPHLFGSVSDLFQEEAVEYQEEQRARLTIPKVEAAKQRQRILDHIANAKTVDQLQQVRAHISEYDCVEEYDAKHTELNGHPEIETFETDLFTQEPASHE